MSSNSYGYGLIPAFSATGIVRPQGLKSGIVSAYNADIYKYQPIKMSTDGVIQAAGVSDPIIGSFAGVQYVDANGRPNYSNQWLANTVATQIVAYFWSDPTITYRIKASGSLAQTAIGDEADFTTTTANALGLSQATLSTTLAGAGNTAVLRIVDLYEAPDNAWGDSYTEVMVQIAEHQYISAKAAI